MTGTDKILVRAPNWIGDAVMSVPAVEALKALCPRSEITVCTRAGALAVFENNPAVAGLIEYDSKGAHAGVKGRVSFARELKAHGFRRAVLFQNAFDAALMARLAGIPERIGYATDMRRALLTRAIRIVEDAGRAHQVWYYLRVVEAMGGTAPEAPMPRLYVSDAERARRTGMLVELGMEGARLIGAAPGASYGPAKRWAPERFAATLAALAEELGAVPLVFGGPDDAGPCAEVSDALERLGVRHADMAGRTTVREFIAMLEAMEVFVANDSGPMHLAAASNIPTVAIFGSTDELATGPLGPYVKVVKKPIDCSPCIERECKYGHYDCLTSVTTEDVLGAARTLVAKRSAESGAAGHLKGGAR